MAPDSGTGSAWREVWSISKELAASLLPQGRRVHFADARARLPSRRTFVAVMTLTLMHLITGLATGGAERMVVHLATRADSRRFRPIVVSMTGPGPMATASQSRSPR